MHFKSHAVRYSVIPLPLLLLLLSRFSRVRLCVTPYMAAHQAPPSLGFSRQEYWSGVPLPSPVIPLASPDSRGQGQNKGSILEGYACLGRETQKQLSPIHMFTGKQQKTAPFLPTPTPAQIR